MVAQYRAICALLRSALGDLSRAIELDPGDAGYYAGRGQAYQATGRNDQALADFARATELDPSYQPPTVLIPNRGRYCGRPAS